MKTKHVYFYVLRTSSSTDVSNAIAYDVAAVNIGGAMDISSGKFTAPVKGRYFFAFDGLVEFTDTTVTGKCYIGLTINFALVGQSAMLISPGAAGDWYQTITYHGTFDLSPGDEVAMRLTSLTAARLHDDPSGTYTHFSGYLIEQDFS